MLLLTNDRGLVKRLGLAPLLQRLEVTVRVAAEDDVEHYLALVAKSRLEVNLILFRVADGRYLDGVDWVSNHWDALARNKLAILAVVGSGDRVSELLVVTNSTQPKVEHVSFDSLSRTVEALLTIHYGFLLDEFAEHDFPGLNDRVEIGGRGVNVQTQFYPGAKPRISTEIYRDGKVLKTFTHHVKDEAAHRRKLLFLIEEMHQKVLGHLESMGLEG